MSSDIESVCRLFILPILAVGWLGAKRVTISFCPGLKIPVHGIPGLWNITDYTQLSCTAVIGWFRGGYGIGATGQTCKSRLECRIKTIVLEIGTASIVVIHAIQCINRAIIGIVCNGIEFPNRDIQRPVGGRIGQKLDALLDST